MEEKPLISRQFSSKSSDINEDVEILLKEMMSRQSLEENKFFNTNMDQHETLSNLRIKRMRESIESPVFGTRDDAYQFQRNFIRKITNNSRDELENAQSRKNYGSIFQKQQRHFSFAESENSSFPSSYKNSILRQESINSRGTQKSNKTPNFIGAARNSRSKIKQSEPNFGYKSPSRFKNHLKAIAQLVGVEQNALVLPKKNSFNASKTI